MKVALLFVGRIITWEHCYETFKKHIVMALLQQNAEIDGFLCHHSDNDLLVRCNPQCEHCRQKDKLASQLFPSSPYPFLEEFKEKYFIRDFMNVSYDISQHPYCEDHNRSPLRMHYCLAKGFEMIKNRNVNYDLVIYLRADQHFYMPLSLPSFPLPEDTLYIPSGNDHAGVNDQFAMGSMKAMEHYTSCFHHMTDIYNETNIPFHTETYVMLHNQTMKIERFYLHYALQRGRNHKE